MAKFLLAYHGGTGISQSPETSEKTMQAWMAWFGKIQPNIVDGGNPVARAWTLSKDGTEEGAGSNATTGYSVIQAESMQQASELAQGCPHLADGGTIELCELAEMG